MIVCDFCFRSEHQVDHIVVAPEHHAAICGDCTKAAMNVLFQRKKEEENKENSTENT